MTKPSPSGATAAATSTAAPHPSALLDVLRRWDPPSGPDGFEGLVVRALVSVSGYTFRLARSGSQFGRDAASPQAPFAIAMEAKRYTDHPSLESLAGKASLAAFSLAESIDLWVLAATIEVSEPTVRMLDEILERGGIRLLTLDWNNAGLPPLGVLLAAAREHVTRWAHTQLDAVDYVAFTAGLDDIAADASFEAAKGKLLEHLHPALLGLDALRARNSEWCQEHFASRPMAQRQFSQFLAPLEEPGRCADRPSIRSRIETAVEVARNDEEGDTLVAVLGGEGSGKSWSVAKWWAGANPRPVLLLSAGRIAEQLSPGDEPLDMLARLAAVQDGRRDAETVQRWRRRIERWSKGNAPANLFIIVVDGLNERSGKPWADILRLLMPAARALGGIVVTTCREHYWDRDVANRLSFVTIEKVPVGDYDDEEFAEIMERNGIALDALPERLNKFMRNPRICALALTMLPRLTGISELSRERLLMEYWRSRLEERGDLVAHNDEDFRDLLIRHARDYRARPGTDFNRNEWRSRSGAAVRGDRSNLGDDLSDIEEGRFFDPGRNSYRFRDDALHFALGLLIADELRDVIRLDADSAEEALDAMIDPIRSFDQVAEIMTASIAIASLDTNYPDRAIRALVSAWMSLQNITDEAFEGLATYVAARPEPFLDAFELRDLDRDDGRFLQLLLLSSRHAPVAQAIDARVDRWLGSWTRASYDWGESGDRRRRAADRSRRIDEKLAQLTEAERAYFAGNCTELANAAGLAGAAALHILGERQERFAKGIVAFAFAHDVAGDHRSPYEEVAWTVRLNREDRVELARRVRQEISLLRGPQASPVARSAAAAALRLLGSLEDQHEADQLSPPRRHPAALDGDAPVDPLDPVAQAPEQFGGGAVALGEIAPDAIWNHMSTSSEDHHFDRVSNLLVRFDPEGLIAFLNDVAATAATRRDMPLRQLAWHLPWLSPILENGAIAALQRRIAELAGNPSLAPTGDQDFILAMLVEAVLPHIGANDQLDLLQTLPPEAPFYLRYAGLAKPLAPDAAEQHLASVSGADPRIVVRTLLFLAAAPGGMSDGYRSQAITCLESDDREIAAAAAELAMHSDDPELDDAVLKLELPTDDHRDWTSGVVRAAIATAIARRARRDLVELIPIEHLDWVAARLPAARPRLADTIEAGLDRLIQPLATAEPSDAIIVLGVEEDPTAVRFHVTDRGEQTPNSIEAINAQINDSTGAGFARRRELLHEQYEAFLDSLTREGALLVARRPYREALAELASVEEQRYAGWLRRILAVSDERSLRSLQNFGFVLAQNYAAIDPELSARTFAHLWSARPLVTVQIGRAKHAIRHLALFAATPSPAIDELRNKAFAEAADDRQIEDLVLAAEAAAATGWLDDFIETGSASLFPADQALALTAASLRRRSAVSDALLARDWGSGFLGSVAATARKRYNAGKHTAYWFEQARAANDPRERWRMLELGIAAADKRQLLDVDSQLASKVREMGGDVWQRLSKAADRASEERSKTLFGFKKPTGLLGRILARP